MSWLCDTTELVPSGWLTSLYAGAGVLAENIPSSGVDGPSALYGAVTLPADNGKEIRGYITRWPAAPLLIDEDGAFSYSGGSDYFEFALYADGVADSTNVGFGPGISRITLSMGGALPTIGRPSSDTSNRGWSPSAGTELYAMLDEVTPNPADYIFATTLGAVCELTLNTTVYPGATSQTLSFRGSSSTGNSVIVRLKNTAGATVRSQTQVLTATDTLYSFTLTAGEVAAITSGALSVILESA